MIGGYNSYFNGQTAGYGGAQGFGQTAGYGGAQGFGQTVGYGGAQGYGQTVGYGGAQGFGQTAGYGASQGFGQSAGYGGAQGYGQAAGYGGGQNFGQSTGFSVVQVGAPVAVQATGFQSSGDFSFGQQQGSANHSGSSSSSSPLAADLTANVGGGAAGVSFEASGASLGSAASVQRRQGRVRKQVVRLPDQPQGPARQVRHRMPTPEPDTIERVFYQRAAADIVEEIIEVPTTPPPRVNEKHVVEPAGPPQKIKRVIRVPPRSGGGAASSQQQVAGVFASGSQVSNNLIGAGSYGNVQQSFGGVASTGGFGGPVSTGGFGGFSGATGGFGGYGASAGGFQQGFGGFSSQPVPRNPAPGSTCFYV